VRFHVIEGTVLDDTELEPELEGVREGEADADAGVKAHTIIFYYILLIQSPHSTRAP